MGGRANPEVDIAERRLALHDHPQGAHLPDWFVASCLLQAVVDLGPSPTRQEYERWRLERTASKTTRTPASAAVIANRFGGWRAALDAAWAVCESSDAARQLVWTLQDRATAQ